MANVKCRSCKYAFTRGITNPCINCSEINANANSSHYEKEKGCHDCKYTCFSCGSEPCKSCEGANIKTGGPIEKYWESQGVQE